ncbi:cilia and flagella associated protein 53 [Cricetulus griseus]
MGGVITAECSHGLVTKDDFRLTSPPSVAAHREGWLTMATNLCVWKADSSGLCGSWSSPSQRDLKMYSQRFGTVPREFNGPTPKAVIIRAKPPKAQRAEQHLKRIQRSYHKYHTTLASIKSNEQERLRIDWMQHKDRTCINSRVQARVKDAMQGFIINTEERRNKERCEELRSKLVNIHEKKVVKERKEQIAFNKELQRQKLVEEQMYARLWEEDRLAKEKREAQEERRQKQLVENTRLGLDAQVTSLQAQRQAAQQKKEEEGRLLEQNRAQIKLEDEKEKLWKQKTKQETRNNLQKALQAKIETMQQEHREDQDLNKKLVGRALQDLQEEADKKKQKREEMEREQKIYNNYLMQRRMEEKAQEKELDRILEDIKAKKLAEKDRELALEKEARKQLVNEVMCTRKLQVQEKRPPRPNRCIESIILITHQPTWDDCQQLLQTLLTTEERQQVLLEAQKNIQEPDGRPTRLPNEIEEVFPLTRRVDWDINTAAGRERHCLCRQTLLADLKGTRKHPTNLAKVNTGRLKLPEGTRVRGEPPGTNWEVDFTEIKPSSFGNRYLLVFIDTFSGWIEAFPTKRETAQVVVKKVLEEIFPRFGLPKVIGSDNGPAFVSHGFKNSPTLFDEALHQDLADFRIHNPNLILLQYVDDLLLAAQSEQDCLQGTSALLQKLGKLGYRASAKKAQLCREQVTYLGYRLQGGQRWLTESRKQAVALIPPPKNAREVQEFLGSAGFWIPGFAELAAPLYPLTKASTPFTWTEEHQKAFDGIKKAYCLPLH